MRFAVIGLNHGHIWGMASDLLRAGAQCVGFFAPEPELVKEFEKNYPGILLRTKAQLLRDPEIDVIVSAGIPGDHAPLAAEAMRAGKDVVLDKPGAVALDQVALLRGTLQETGRLLFVVFGERLGSKLDIRAKQLIDEGAIGKPVHLMGLGPHRLAPANRPAWMWEPTRYGGLMNDIGSHQVEWFCWLTGQKIKSFHSRVGAFGAGGPPGFLDFADATVTAADGTTGYLRVDWFTPPKSPTWGDGRNFIIGTKGTIEIRRNANLGALNALDGAGLMILTNDQVGGERVDVSGVEVTWARDVVASVKARKNLLFDHDMLMHAIEMSVRIQRDADRVKG